MPEKCGPGGNKRHLPAIRLAGLWLILALCANATPALAHRVLVFAFAEGDTIHTESKFVPDTPVRQGKILVLDAKTGKELLTGQTDDKGKFSFKIPAAAAAEKMDLKIVVVAAMGHRGEWLLKAASYPSGAPSASPPSPTVAPAPDQPPADTGKMPGLPAKEEVSGGQGSQAANLDQQALEAALNKALERHLAPLKEMLTELTIHRTSLTDIIGGLGWIMGLFGLWAYFASKRS
jgi:nickel transport protein